MTLSVDIRHGVGGFDLNVTFVAEAGVTALFGVSGSGKTTVVNAVAGLLRPDSGRIAFGDTVFFDAATGQDVPAHKRRIGYVFQDARLFPHLNVRQNLTYPCRFLTEKTGSRDVEAIVDLLGIGDLLARRPGRLSGGERQRVAIGRALLSRPRLLLLDEPLAALDKDRRDEVLPYLARLRDETDLPILYISHARAEVRALASKVVVLTGGRVSADGPVGEVLGRGGAGPAVTIPVTSSAKSREGSIRLETGAGSLESLPERVPVTGAKAITIVASDIVLTSADREAVAAANVLPVKVVEILKAGPGHMDVVLMAASEKLVARVALEDAARLQIAPGQSLNAIIGRFTLS